MDTIAATTAERTLGATLRDARKSKGLSLRAAAAGSGISYSTLSRLESGHRDSAPLGALLSISRKLDLPSSLVMELAGGLSQEGLGELVGAHLRGALRGGRLSPGATAALRRVHVARLLEPLAVHLAQVPVELGAVAAAAELRVIEGAGEPGFDVDGTYLVRRHVNPLQRVIQRGWMAHGIAHALLAADARERPSCTPRAQILDREQEANYLATLILIPSAALAAILRVRPLGDLAQGEDVGAALDEIVSDFDAPATFAAARLTEEGVLAVVPL